jgi:hypothetical protein
MVIPAMDKLNSCLDPKLKVQYHLAIKAAMRLAQAKMDQYYSLTDGSPVYRIAMGMCPLDILMYFWILNYLKSPSSWS